MFSFLVEDFAKVFANHAVTFFASVVKQVEDGDLVLEQLEVA